VTTAEFQKAQQDSLPDEDLRPYAGQWVAIRHGHVVASALDPVVLREMPEVESTDLLTPVPAAGDALLIL
jgi:hypothetical protein